MCLPNDLVIPIFLSAYFSDSSEYSKILKFPKHEKKELVHIVLHWSAMFQTWTEWWDEQIAQDFENNMILIISVTLQTNSVCMSK